jgi:hypothetical protein
MPKQEVIFVFNFRHYAALVNKVNDFDLDTMGSVKQRIQSRLVEART